MDLSQYHSLEQNHGGDVCTPAFPAATAVPSNDALVSTFPDSPDSPSPIAADIAGYQAVVSRGLSGVLGIEVIEVSADRVVATMPVNDRSRQPFGVLHGGASMTLAETAASLGAWTGIDAERFAAFALDLNATHVRASREGIVTAVAKRAHRGRRTQVWTVEIHDDAGQLVCIARCTMAIVALGRDQD